MLRSRNEKNYGLLLSTPLGDKRLRSQLVFHEKEDNAPVEAVLCRNYPGELSLMFTTGWADL